MQQTLIQANEFTWFEKHRETKISGLKRRILIFTKEQEILRLQVSMHDSHSMTVMNHRNNLPANIRRSSFGVMSLNNYPVKKLPAGTKLHHKINRVSILISTFELNNVTVAGKMMHDLNLTANIIDIVTVYEFACGYWFASELFLGDFMGYQISNAELATAEFTAEGEDGADVFHGAAEDAAEGGW